MIAFHRQYAPAFNFDGHQDQYPVGIYTVLSINESVGDCAAYEGIGPASPVDEGALLEKVRAGGKKISENAAREIFSEIEDMGLRYRL